MCLQGISAWCRGSAARRDRYVAEHRPQRQEQAEQADDKADGQHYERHTHRKADDHQRDTDRYREQPNADASSREKDGVQDPMSRHECLHDSRQSSLKAGFVPPDFRQDLRPFCSSVGKNPRRPEISRTRYNRRDATANHPRR
jgi:hypothetical protein